MPYFRTITDKIAYFPHNIRGNGKLIKSLDDQLVRVSQFDKRCSLCVANKLHTMDDHTAAITDGIEVN
jgi:hypothetical protein